MKKLSDLYIIKESKKSKVSDPEEALYIELDDESKIKCFQYAKTLVANTTNFSPKYYCDRMYISTGLKNGEEKYYNNNKDEKYEMLVTHIGISDSAIALKVDLQCRCSMGVKYIILATNTSKGGKVTDPADFTTWDRCGLNFILHGKLKLVKKDDSGDIED